MNLPCEVIRDLLPLYHDHVCSATSERLVQEHLESCEACRKELSMMDHEIEKPRDIEESKPIRAIAREWKKDRKSSFFLGAFIVSLLGALSCFIAFQAIGSYLEPDGTLVEPFGLIPIGYLFGLLAVIFGITFTVIKRWKARH